ncbi:hypothetical protein WI29_27605 [Burkholderia ubonensis]|nr:hypothetical protein WI31_27145 [Burkholderia ubonensis]KUZ12528.1 hypothetical protein WI29_27605 [Burkholderia ubonensis]KUZ33723.1 hypothetical protein WI30_14110 [Burkholderia ubonensis]KUZ48553.1 hypothetical protein WI33_20865 [Burkholderia ubonensis]KUZ64053.1 hypothetical protein WI34_04390 [Burkholderia ubonensis]
MVGPRPRRVRDFAERAYRHADEHEIPDVCACGERAHGRERQRALGFAGVARRGAMRVGCGGFGSDRHRISVDQ